MNELRELLFEKKAALVGFGNIEGRYEDYEHNISSVPKYPRGVSIAMAIPKEVIRGIEQSPTGEYFEAYHSLNHQLDTLAEYCAEYLIKKGYHAYAQTVGRSVEFGVHTTAMPHKTVAVSAGLGWIGKSALLVTPKYGSAIRLTSVLTDAPVPVIEEQEASKCGNCMICKEACPAGAVTGNLWNDDQDRDWIFDAAACRKKARDIAAASIGKEITLCGKCIVVCPYTRNYAFK